MPRTIPTSRKLHTLVGQLSALFFAANYVFFLKADVAPCDTWQPIGHGSASLCDTLAVFQDQLVAGGEFNVGDQIARWNGAAWQSLGSGIPEGGVSAMIVHEGELIVGGTFFVAGGQPVHNIARWNGTTWQPMGNPIMQIYAMTIYEGQLIIGGTALDSTNVKRWNGSSWENLPNGLSESAVVVLTSFEGDLIAGGDFRSPSHIARWRTGQAQWLSMGSGVNGSVHALVVHDRELIAGGVFSMAGGQPATCIARWNGTSWQPLPSQVSNAVFDLTLYQGDLIAGGAFLNAGGLNVNRIARWTGVNWEPLGTGMSGGAPPSNPPSVYGLIKHNDELIAAGGFTLAGGSTCLHIARWSDCPDQTCPDISGDNQVNVLDLLAVIDAWGTCSPPPAPCETDIAPPGGDGQVNVTDLFEVVNAWGACP